MNNMFVEGIQRIVHRTCVGLQTGNDHDHTSNSFFAVGSYLSREARPFWIRKVSNSILHWNGMVEKLTGHFFEMQAECNPCNGKYSP